MRPISFDRSDQLNKRGGRSQIASRDNANQSALTRETADVYVPGTIIRQEKTAKQRKAQTLDTVQVDVGIGANDEIYSWPGETAFSSGGLEQLVGQGLVGSGFFAVDSKNLFLGNAAIVKPAEEQNAPGKGPTRFSYRIPSLMNHWLVNWLGIRAVVGESGEFWTTKIREPYVGLERSLKTYRLSCH